MARKGGQAGNNNAAKGKLWRAALERALARKVKGKAKTIEKGLDPIADVVVANALNGDKDSWQEIANRMDGKHAQSVTIGGDEENPVQTITRIERVILDDSSTDKDS